MIPSIRETDEDLALEVANADDEGQLSALAKKTCVLISTVGPFALYGEPVLRVCAQAGTHYLDCTGEAAWVARMIKKYSKTARETGAIMVPQNGIESAPADLCTWSLARFLAAEMGAKTKDVAIVTQEMRFVSFLLIVYASILFSCRLLPPGALANSLSRNSFPTSLPT